MYETLTHVTPSGSPLLLRLRRLHFMRPFAPCFSRLVAGAQVYLLKHAHSSRLSNSQTSSWGIGATVSSGFVEAIQGEMFCCQQKSST